MENQIIKIDLNEIQVLMEDAGTFMFKPGAEESLKKLKAYRDRLDEVEEYIKEKIMEEGRKLNPEFKGVIGEEVKVVVRKYGAKYNYDWKNKTACEPFLKKKEYYSVDGDKVDAYLEEVGEMPEGIIENLREPKVSINYGDSDDEN